MNTSNYKIVSAAEVTPIELATFYDEYFGHATVPFKKYWKWHNRVDDFDNAIPLIMLDGEKVIAHAGMRPFKVEIAGKSYNAAWYIDFMVHKDYRRQGLGSIITKEFTKLTKLSYAVTGNEKSMGAFRKLGWSESSSSYMHYFLFKPFNHNRLSSLPTVIKYAGNVVAKLFWQTKYKKYKSSRFTILEITDKNLQLLKTKSDYAKVWTPLRDIDFWRWRLLSSPFVNQYFLFEVEGSYIIYKELKGNGNKIVELLYLDTSLSERKIVKILGVFSNWAFRNDMSYLRLYTTNEKLSTVYKRSFFSMVSKQEFAYIANDTEVKEILENNTKWDFQYIDNDFEVL